MFLLPIFMWFFQENLYTDICDVPSEKLTLSLYLWDSFRKPTIYVYLWDFPWKTNSLYLYLRFLLKNQHYLYPWASFWKTNIIPVSEIPYGEPASSYHIIIRFLITGTGATSTSVDPLPGSWLAACMADLTPDLQVCLSWGSLQFFSVSCFHVIFGLPCPCFPSTCRSKAVLTAPLERSTCTYQKSLSSFRMRSRSSMPSHAIISLVLVVTMSCSLTLQICLIIAL